MVENVCKTQEKLPAENDVFSLQLNTFHQFCVKVGRLRNMMVRVRAFGTDRETYTYKSWLCSFLVVCV